ncbi:hypothetical protein BJ742DRAFT_565612 [Cladochytrium replicatum]|nr:hypothetical protein BJ742DRAFT_565612 [Cladochytrium replicatum]
MYWMARSFYLELESMSTLGKTGPISLFSRLFPDTDLLNNFREATQTVWEKEAALKELTKQVKLLEKLSNLQQERLDKVSVNSSALVSFYNEVCSRQQRRQQQAQHDRGQMGSVEGLSERLTKRIGSIQTMYNSDQEPTHRTRNRNKKPSMAYNSSTGNEEAEASNDQTPSIQSGKPSSNERFNGRRQTAKRHPRLSSHREQRPASSPPPRSRGQNRSASTPLSIQRRQNPRSRDVSRHRSTSNENTTRKSDEFPPLIKERPRTKRRGAEPVELPELRQPERRRNPSESRKIRG